MNNSDFNLLDKPLYLTIDITWQTTSKLTSTVWCNQLTVRVAADDLKPEAWLLGPLTGDYPDDVSQNEGVKQGGQTYTGVVDGVNVLWVYEG